MQQYKKHRCLFCDALIRREHVVCQQHLPWYRKYKDTAWFQEIRRLHRRQETIDARESGYYTENGKKVIANTTRMDKIEQLLRERLSNKDIAERMQVSTNYVRAIRSHLRKKQRLE